MSKVARVDKFSVVVAIILAILFFREKIDAREGFGAGLIICGTILIAWK